MANVATILLLTEMELRSEERAEQFLAALERHAPELLPERFGSNEPFRQSTKVHGLKAFVTTWNSFSGVYWSSGRRVANGGMSHAFYPQHEFLRIYCTYPRRRADLDALFQTLVDAYRPDLAGLHVNTTLEVEGRQVFGREDAFGCFATTFSILNGLPRLWWKTCFGQPYVEMFGRERLLATPGVIATLGAHEAVTLQLSPSLDDCVRDPEQMEARRLSMAEYLGDEYFAKPAPPERIRLLEPPVLVAGPPPVRPKVPNFPDVPEWLQDRERRAQAAERGERLPFIEPRPRPY
jgi:hypothetical protein